MNNRPFAGIKVLDFTRVLAGPYCAYQLGLLGADVVKVERPGRGETIRWRTEADPAFGRNGMSLGFMTQAANKRCIAVDVDRPEGREIFLRLAANADVVVQNLRTGSAEKRGIGYQDIKALNPGVIYCSVTAYGNTGPKQRHAAYDSVIQAWSGLMSITGTPESAPLKAGPPIVDYATGIAAAYAVSAALFQRGRTGEGQYIDLSMLDTTMVLMASVVTAYLNTGVAPKPAGNDAASRAPASTTFNTADGLLAIAVNEEHQYQNLLRVLGLQELNNDSRFAQPSARRENVPALRAAIQQTLMSRTAADWEALLNEAGVPGGRVRTIPEALGEAQIESRSLFHTFPPGMTGFSRDLRIPLAPFRFEHDGPQADTPPRPVGSDTDAVLQDLGYSADDIRGLRESGVI
ncbi:MAG: CoA transferase [Betaproteobacteria bacterium]|nr:CoA transferase [Betaproteobacteria bacterium]